MFLSGATMNTTRTRTRVRIWLPIAIAAVAALASWLGYSAYWLRQRQAFMRDHQASLADATEVDAPGILGLFGEKGVNMIRLTDASQGEFDWVQDTFPEAHVTNLVRPHPR